MPDDKLLKKEAEAFDQQVEERIKHGFIPDLRRLKKVDWFFNNVWRDPEFVRIYLMPKIDVIIDIAKERGGKVIELGCGYGYLSLELARNGLDVMGVDLSPKSIEIAKKFAKENPFIENFGFLKYICTDFLSMDLGENIFDSVIFFGTLHHIKELDFLLSNVRRALKKGGNIIAYEPIRDNFTKISAEFAAILRAILPTWIPFSKKLRNLNNSNSWKQYVEQIYNEYTYRNEHIQSPCDNVTASGDILLNAFKKFFEIQKIEYSNAFIDKLIGGLRGENKYELAKFLKFLDDELIKRDLLPPISILIHAKKI